MNIIIAFYILLDIAFIGFFAMLFRQRIRERFRRGFEWIK